jgi:hypothetical protein
MMLMLEISFENEDDFTHNLATFRAEPRFALGVPVPAGLVKGSLRIAKKSPRGGTGALAMGTAITTWNCTLMRAYAPTVEVIGSGGGHARRVHAAPAETMADSGTATIGHQNGRGRSIRSVECAATHARLLGRPTGAWGAVRFHRWVSLDCGAHVAEYHPRATNYDD